MALLVNDTTPSVQYTATAAQTTFAYPFEIFEDADIKVYQVADGVDPDDTTDLLTLTTHYTVTNAGVTGGGDIVLVTGATVDDVITIKRDLAVKRTTDYQNLGDLASTSLNDDLDKLVMMVQQNEEAFGRSISLQESTQTPTTFDIDDPVAEFYAVAKADLSGIKWLQLLSAGDLSVSAFMQTVLDDTTSAEARTTLGAQAALKGSDIASASALTLGIDGNSFDVTGTTTITSISTAGVGVHITLQFDGALILTHHATDLILPSGENITTTAGDIAVFYEYAAGDWRLITYSRNNLPIPTQIGGEYIKLSDVKSSGTHGGTFTQGSYQTRALNTEDSDTGNHCSLSSNQFTLDAGTYRILASAPAFDTDTHKVKLYNITDTADEIIGTSGAASSANNGFDVAFVAGEFTITSAKAFEIQHRCNTTKTTQGFGIAAAYGEDEVYTIVELWKVK